MAEADDNSFIDALEEAHAFPCRYTFKVIGENTDTFLARAIEVVRLTLPEQVPETTTRKSSGGKAQSVTLVATVPTAEVVAAIHRRLGKIPGARIVL